MRFRHMNQCCGQPCTSTSGSPLPASATCKVSPPRSTSRCSTPSTCGIELTAGPYPPAPDRPGVSPAQPGRPPGPGSPGRGGEQRDRLASRAAVPIAGQHRPQLRDLLALDNSLLDGAGQLAAVRGLLPVVA